MSIYYDALNRKKQMFANLVMANISFTEIKHGELWF